MANQEQVYENVDLQVIKLLFNSDNGDYKVYAVRILNPNPALKMTLTQEATITGDMGYYNRRAIITADLVYDDAGSLRYNKPSYKLARLHFGLPKEPRRQWQLIDTLLVHQPTVRRRLHEHFADDTPILTIFSTDQVKPDSVPGIGPTTIKKIATAIRGKLEIAVLANHWGKALSSMTYEKIWLAYKDANLAMQSIDANPYLLMSVAQLDFKKVDTFAKTRGIAANDPHRLTAGLQYIFRTAVLTQGLTYITITWFRQQAATLLAVREADLKMFADPQEALQYGFLLNEQYGLVTSCDMFATEGSVARIIKVAQKTAEPLMAPDELDDALDQFLDRFHLTINDQQRAAFQNVNRHGLSVLNGSAGTGKTWLTDLLVRFFNAQAKGKSVLLAPTGRAAKVLAKYTHEPAATIHAYLHLLPGEETGQFDADADWETFGDARLIVVDESSMLTTPLAYTVLKNVNFKKAHVLFVGDVFQLPPIGPGNFLKDCLDDEQVAATTLTRVYRQDSQSGVLALANRIRERLALPFGPDDDRYVSGNVALYNQRNAGRVFDAGVKAYQDALVKSGQQIDAQLLIVNKNIGETGRLRFNAELQALVNPAKNGEPEYISSYVDPVTNQKHHLRLNDRVMILKNDKHVPLVDPKTWERRAVLGENGLQQTDDFGTKRWRETIVANGDTGVVAHIDTKRHFVVVQIGQQYCYYSFGSVPRDLTLAYAITVHKAQGGQADTVIAIVNGADMMLNAQSFYTALTRTQQQFIFFGDFRVLLARTKIYPIDARHDLLGSFLSGQLTVDTFSRYTFDQVLAWLDRRHAERLSTRPALEAEEVKPSEQPFAVRYAEQLDILDQIVDEVAQLPARKSARDV